MDNESGVVSLPPELLDQIATYLDPSDIANVRLACALLCQTFTPYLVPRLTLILTDKVTKRLSKSRHPFGHPFIPTPESLTGFIKDLRIRLSHPCLDLVGDHQRESVIIISRREISRFVSLERLTMLWQGPRPSLLDPASSVGDIEEKLLGAIPNSARFHSLEVGSLRISPMILGQFTHLKSFTTSNTAYLRTASPLMVQQVNALLTIVPTLTRLNLNMTFSSGKALLNNLFPSSAIHSHLSLRSLHFFGALAWPRTSSSSKDLPNLPNLRQLFVEAYNSPAEDDWDGLWDLLSQMDTQLHDIYVVHPPTLPLIDYLASFRGLQQLILFHEPRGPTDISFNIAAPLVLRVLPMHAATLQKLIVHIPGIGLHTNPASEGRLFTSIWPSPTCFPNLKYLWTWAPRGWSFSLEACQSVFDWLEQFPSLIHAITLFSSFWQSSATASAPEFCEIGKGLVVRTGKPKEWTLFYNYELTYEDCTWTMEQREDGTGYFTQVKKEHDLTWTEEWD